MTTELYYNVNFLCCVNICVFIVDGSVDIKIDTVGSLYYSTLQ